MVAANCFTPEIGTLDLAILHGFHRKPRVTPRDLPLLEHEEQKYVSVLNNMPR